MQCIGRTQKKRRCKQPTIFLVCHHHGLQLIGFLLVTVPTMFALYYLDVYQGFLKPTYNRFFTVEEVNDLPHLSYEYTSNYPQKYLRLKNVESDELESKLQIANDSKYILKNCDINLYLAFNTWDLKSFLRPYNLKLSDYVFLGKYNYPMIEKDEKIPIDLITPLTKLLKNKEVIIKFLLPEWNQFQDLVQVRSTSEGKSPINLFTDDKSLLDNEFRQLIGTNALGRDYPYGFNGAMLKIIIDYEINEIKFKHLLVGGMYHQYAKVENRNMPMSNAVGGFFKTDISLWKRNNSETFSPVNIPQEIRYSAEQGIFESPGEFKPGEEVALRIRPDIAFPTGRLIPLRFYIRGVNNLKDKNQH